jgi:TfoX/Sxy family transcriptional regulator of competence genes
MKFGLTTPQNPNMASEQKFVDFIVEQIDISLNISYKKMFGEHSLYFDNKIFALI